MRGPQLPKFRIKFLGKVLVVGLQNFFPATARVKTLFLEIKRSNYPMPKVPSSCLLGVMNFFWRLTSRRLDFSMQNNFTSKYRACLKGGGPEAAASHLPHPISTTA